MPDSNPQQTRPSVLSGMRPTGRLHLGNYMGALFNWVNLQNELDPLTGQPKYDCFFFIADWHALTTDYADPSRLKQNVFEIALDFLAAGLDPDRSTIFIQSHVPQHAELHLLLSMITPVSWLERVPTYKDQQEQLREKDLATYGFLGYPLLQSADILLYRPKYVPVGADQVAHVEITREVARRFNFLYPRGGRSEAPQQREGDTPTAYARLEGDNLLPEPVVLLTPSPKLPGTDGRKMSKSYGNSILLSDPRAVILEKLHGMTNGGQRPTLHDPGDPEICPVGDLHRVFSQPLVDQHIRSGCRTATISCERCKELAGLSIIEHVGPIQTRREELENDPDQVWDALDRGRDRAAAVCGSTMTHLREVMGLSRDRSGVRVERNASRGTPAANPRDLSAFAAWWNLEPRLLSRNLQELWFKTIKPSTVDLKPSGEGVWITLNNRRVLVAVAIESAPGLWSFAAKPKSYELLVLLCWQSNKELIDLVLPQQLFIAPWAAAKKRAGKGDLVFTVARVGDTFHLILPGAEPIDLTGTEANYKIMGS